jgi:hypothetical protein
MPKPNVLAVSPFSGTCGISEYMHYLHDALHRADRTLILDVEENLHPDAVLSRSKLPPVIFLNYQAALLSQWHPEHIREVQAKGSKVLVLWHDSGHPNTEQGKALAAVADRFVVHEPFDDLPETARHIQHGVPAWQDPFYFELIRSQQVEKGLWWYDQPVVGSVGLSLWYRNYDRLCEGSALAGWGALLLAPNATEADEARWHRLNPAARVIRLFLPRDQVISYLSGCTATAFLVDAHHGGVSGSIRQGIAACRPLYAYRARIFCDLADEPAIRWVDTPTAEALADALSRTPDGRDFGLVRLAARDRWSAVATVWAALIRELLV